MKKVVIALLITQISVAFAHHDPDESIWAYCERQKFSFDRHDKAIKVMGHFSWALKNKSDTARNWTATMRICFTETGKCNAKILNISQQPWGKHAEFHTVFVTESFSEIAHHPFKVTLDITGDRQEHTEKTCEAVIKK